VVGDPAHSRGLKLNDHCAPLQPRPFYDSMTFQIAFHGKSTFHRELKVSEAMAKKKGWEQNQCMEQRILKSFPPGTL